MVTILKDFFYSKEKYIKIEMQRSLQMKPETYHILKQFLLLWS